MIHPRTSTVALHTRKGRPKIRRSMDLVHQAVPRTSFHPVFQGCQHAVCPDCGFDPGPAVPYSSGPSSPEGHCGRFVFPSSVHHASTFLPPFAPRPLRRFSATMEALTPVRVSLPHRSPRLTYSTVRTIPSPTTLFPLSSLYTRYVVLSATGLLSQDLLPFVSAQAIVRIGLGFAHG